MKLTSIPPHNTTVATVRPATFPRALLAAVMLVFGVAGCSVLPQRQTPHALTTYRITAPTVHPAAKTRSSCPALRISSPTAVAGFSGPAMRYSETPGTIAPFAFHRWAAPPASMLGPILVQTMSDSGLFATVLDSNSPGTAPLQLNTQLIALVQQVDGMQSHIHLVIRVSLTDLVAHSQIAAHRFVIDRQASANTPGAGARATDAAVARWTDELVTWIHNEHLCPAQ